MPASRGLWEKEFEIGKGLRAFSAAPTTAKRDWERGAEKMKRFKRIFPWAAVLLCAGAFFSFFHVSGREIAGAAEISDCCRITIAKYPTTEWKEREEVVLKEEQAAQLKELILGGSFTREFSSVVTGFERTAYDIQVDFQDGQRFLSIHCLGGDYISVVDQFGGKHLKNWNKEWVASLEQIMQEASPAK